MKKVVFVCTTAVLLAAFTSCKNETKSSEMPASSDTTEDSKIPSEEMALANAPDANSDLYLYVTAPSGLSLREFGNLQSEKLARMPYGTKVRVIRTEDHPTMTVSGIKGGMNEVEFNHKKGFAFNGYLSKYFPPEPGITARAYASELQELFPKVAYAEETGGTVINPSNTEIITLPDAQWHEAFYIAQRLFDFPEEFEFPDPAGKKNETIFDGKPKKGSWKSQLEISRNDDGLEQIMYVYGSEKFDSNVTITKEGNAMKISRTEVIK